jgi:hypothetical protein
MMCAVVSTSYSAILLPRYDVTLERWTPDIVSNDAIILQGHRWTIVLLPLPRIAGAFCAPTLFGFVASDLGERGLCGDDYFPLTLALSPKNSDRVFSEIST